MNEITHNLKNWFK